MTEDMLTEQANILSRLGTSEEAAKVRAKMQSSSLISDMQAFKVGHQYRYLPYIPLDTSPVGTHIYLQVQNTYMYSVQCRYNYNSS